MIGPVRRLLVALVIGIVHPDVHVAGAQHAPPEMTARKREVVRAAAEPYRGIAVEVVVEPEATAAERAFGTALVEVLHSAGLVVNRVANRGVGGRCPAITGLQVLFSPERSGAANAIAEALGRARVVGSPVGGCRITGEGVLIIVVREKGSAS